MAAPWQVQWLLDMQPPCHDCAAQAPTLLLHLPSFMAAALGFDDLLGGAISQPQSSPARPQGGPLGGLGLGGAAMGGAGTGGQKLPTPPAKKDPFADLLG